LSLQVPNSLLIEKSTEMSLDKSHSPPFRHGSAKAQELVREDWLLILGRPMESERRSLDARFGAISFPKVTILVCRLPLSTWSCWPSTFYRGDLLRFIVRLLKKLNILHWFFKGHCERSECLKKVRHFASHISVSPVKLLPRSLNCQKEKKTLFEEHTAVTNFICVAAQNFPFNSVGIWTNFPFALWRLMPPIIPVKASLRTD
jgi:hypothetical protein